MPGKKPNNGPHRQPGQKPAVPAPKLAPARRAALRLFSECRRREARARDLLREAPAMAELDPRDRALTTRLVLGAIAARGEVDRVVTSHLRARSALEPLVRDALRIAAFEILYRDTPAQVAVSQGVELVRCASRRAAGLGNAVLRRVADEDAAALEAALARVESGDFTAADLQRIGGLPGWLAERAMADLGPEAAAAYAAGALEPACASVAANTAKHGVDECRALLAEAGCEPEPGPVAGSFILGRPSALAPSGLVGSCDVLPCDLAAQDVVASLGVRAGERVLEVGQGRGTKSVLMAAAARMEAAGVDGRVECVCDDGRELARVDGAFGLVFVDAPCSGAGTLSRHPEIAWSLKEDDLSGLAELQLQILRRAATRVADGGRLAYSTCSIIRQEDEDVVDAFLASPEGARFCLVSARRTDISHTDTHFLALLERA